MKGLIFTLLFSLSFLSFSQHKISGTVLQESNNKALSGATVKLKNTYMATFTDANGKFVLDDLPLDTYTVIVSYIGYSKESATIDLTADKSIKFELAESSVLAEEVIVSATRVDKNSASTVSNISEKEIQEENLGRDIPYLLQKTPSLITTSDAGTGIGYTGMRIRGIDQNRINVTINGIPLNDAESHGVFWVNMPDFASSLENVQIQRGVGYSTNGAGAFGATVNLQTTGFQEEAFGEISNSYGSFNTHKHTVKFGTGMLNNKFAFEGRLSKIKSDGYIDRATSDLQSYFFSGGYYGEKTIIKAVSFGGEEKTYQSWYGTPESRLENDIEGMLEYAENNFFTAEQTQNLLSSGRTYNYYTYYNQTDNYKQNHYQLHFSHQFSEKMIANLSFHYTKGEGYYEDFLPNQDFGTYLMHTLFIGTDTINSTDLIRRKWLDNDFYGLTYSFLFDATEKLKLSLGGGYNNYEGGHFGHVMWAEYASNSFPDKKYYYNLGEKSDFNSFLKAEYSLSKKIQLFADAQFRNIDYQVNGNDDDQSLLKINENYLFFNPKAGINYSINNSSSIYAFYGIAHREPNRTDLIDKPKDIEMLPEELRNLELGYELRKRNYFLNANFYYMAYDNQLVLTGELNDIGTPLKQNIKKSYRSGIELQAAFKPHKKISLQGNAALSRNKMVRDEIGETDLSFSPEVVCFAELEYKPIKSIELAISNKYVGDQYLDNTSNDNRKIESYSFTDFRFSYSLQNKWHFEEIEVMFQLNNILDQLYSTNGWTYSYELNHEVITSNHYYPQAGINYMLGLNLRF